MKFTNLNKRLDGDRSYLKNRKPKSKKAILRMLLVLFVIAAVIYLPIRGVYQSSKKLMTSGKAVGAAFQSGNLDDVKKNLKEVRKATNNLNGSLNWLFWLRIIPFAGGYYGDAKGFVNAANYELEAAQVLVESLDPYKNELGFTGQPIPGQDKVAQFVKILDKVIPQLDKVEPQLKKASDYVKNINVEKYPESWGKYRVRSQVEAAKNMITGIHYAATEARSALEVAPSALGEPSAKNYLIIFQNDKEMRATGGFMTAYATLELDKGRVSSSASDDIYRLDEKLLIVCRSKICPLSPPDPLVKYLPEANGDSRTAWSMRDSNLSPDVPTSMRDFERMYQMLGEGLPYDGIILIDTHVVEDLIKITGPIEVFGTTYSAEKDSRCNCPNVVYELERYAQIIEKGEADRKAILGTLMQQILARSLGVSVQKAPEFINAGTKLANSKHVMFFMHDEKTQAALSKLNWTGEIKTSKGDYLHVNDSNFAGGKSNLYVEEGVELDIDPKTGKHKLTINYSNPQPYNAWLNGINRDYIRIYVPRGANLISSNGSDTKVTTQEDEGLNKTYFEAFIQVRPQNSRTISFEYELQDKFSGKEYPILIQRQPGTKDFKYTVKVNGKQKASFNLDADKELKLSL